MKKIRAILFAILLLLCLSACSAKTEKESTEGTSVSENTETPQDEKTDSSAADDTGSSVSSSGTEAEGKVLVVYFSATGTTKGVAEKIAKLTGGDLYEIVPEEAYSDADLNWNDSNSRSTKEQNDKSARPKIAGEKIDLSAYTTIYIGFPIWWGEEPRIMEEQDTGERR